MFLGELTQEVSGLRGVGPALAGRLERLGIRTINDLLLTLPRDYEDRTAVVPLAQASGLEKACVVVTVTSLTDVGWGRSRVPKAAVQDASGQAVLVAFGRPFLRSMLQPGRIFFVYGTFRPRRGEVSCSDFELEPWSEQPASFGKVLPIYPLTEGMTQASMRKLVRAALDQHAAGLESRLPAALVRRKTLMPTAEALQGVHFPMNQDHARRCREVLAYEELFYFELMVLRRKSALAVTRPARRSLDPSLRDRLIERLPFQLTADQKTVCSEIAADLSSAAPMARLLQGEVGCGKTLVAFLSALLVIAGREQVAFIAPTELLARQHAENAARLLEPMGIRMAFLSGAVTGEPRELLLAALRAGEIDLLFGTHALFSQDVAFRALGLVVVDEQHRFGVLQRQALLAKGANPDMLLMTATPIPRTLALTAFGDLDVSTIRTMPAGRKAVITHLTREGNEEKVYERVRQEIERGRQAYFVYPLIGQSETLAVKDAETAYRLLKEKVYPGVTAALIHSKLTEDEKAAGMAGFASGAVRILVATSVVEVGVDVSNATCMVVEHAERFGLSTLHQLRGRVGRGSEQSYAFLVYGNQLTPDGVQRLRIMKETTDGFVIAERDLALRGPGELLGVRQSGFLNFRAADLLVHSAQLLEARDDVRALLSEDPGFLAPENSVVQRVLTAAPPFPVAAMEGG